MARLPKWRSVIMILSISTPEHIVQVLMMLSTSEQQHLGFPSF